MKDLSYGIFTIFIAFVIFTVIKNVFFNANQLSKKIRYKYFIVSITYFIIFVLGLATVAAISKEKNNQVFASIDTSFFFITLSIIYTSIRMDSNDTSANNIWYFSVGQDLEGPKTNGKETSLMKSFYIFIAVGAFASALWMCFINENLDIHIKNSFISFSVISVILTWVVSLLNLNTLGALIRANLLYNFLWKMAQNGTFKDEGQAQKASKELIILYVKLFRGRWYNSDKHKKRAKQINGWIEDIPKHYTNKFN